MLNARARQVLPRLRALGVHDEEAWAVLSVLGADLAKLGRGGPKAGAAASGNARALLANALTRMIQSLCEDRPHAFVWDAAHSMD